MNITDLLVPLDAIPVFRGIPHEHLQVPGAIRHWAVGDRLVEPSSERRTLHIILNGNVAIVDDDTQIATRGAHDLLGELALIDGLQPSAVVTATTSVTTLTLPEKSFSELLRDPSFVNNLLQHVTKKLREATGDRAEHYRRENLLFAEFRAHVSPEVAEELLGTGKRYGEPRHEAATILFADVRNFTTHCTNMTPSDIGRELTTYFDAIVDVIHAHRGVIDKYIGDAILAFWSGLDQHEAERQAVECAEALLARTTTMTFGGAPIRIGVGIATGEVFLGNVGTKRKKQFTVLGTPVNLAARLQTETKTLQTEIVIDEATHDALPKEHQQRFSRDECEPKGLQQQHVYTQGRTA